MELKDGDKYIKKSSGWRYKLIESKDGRWFLRCLERYYRGSMFKMSTDKMMKYLKEEYDRKE